MHAGINPRPDPQQIDSAEVKYEGADNVDLEIRTITSNSQLEVASISNSEIEILRAENSDLEIGQ